MCLKIRCDGESEKFCKIFWELNKAQIYAPLTFPSKDEVASNNGAKPLTLSLNVTTYVEWTLQGPWNFLPITGTDIALVYFKQKKKFKISRHIESYGTYIKH